MSFVSFLLEEAAAPQQSIMMSVMPFILIIVIFYFFIIRPQNKKQKETQKMIDALKKGDKVVTIGGIHGVVASTKEKTVIVKVDDSTKIEFSRSAISGVETDKPAKAGKAEKTEEKSEKTEAAADSAASEENK
ncbi:MAG: preprotein translocase subunit YajC [Treponema sp.]|nr:preprotein translocase subunit YajC [Treponema sp.]